MGITILRGRYARPALEGLGKILRVAETTLLRNLLDGQFGIGQFLGVGLKYPEGTVRAAFCMNPGGPSL